ncbi:hypothetical protein AMJ49_00710 [Parcubacteria bacterium DG_74_2]|nr:MAG: hypothetical protein AMJ49_00710 [Parcubacteria bacterium DG_74_2]
MRKTNIFLILFSLIVISLGFWIYQRNLYSKEVLKLEILGSNEAEIGELVEYIVKYKNNGDFRLDEPELIFEAPANSLMEEGKPLRQIFESDELGGAIYPGEEKTFSFEMRLMGREGEAKIAKASLSYRPKNLKARSESSTSFTTIIKSVSITFEFDMPSMVGPEKDFSIRVNYFSNVDYPLSGLRILVEYPFGFEILESNPKPLEKNEWDIGLLNKSEGGRIEILGRISGEIGEEKIFKAKLISWQDEDFVLLKEVLKGVKVTKPLLYIRQEINGNPEYITLPGDWLHYEIFFKNIGDESLQNLFLVNKLEGDAFDFETIKSELGSFKEGDNSIIFDWRKILKLQYLAPMQEGKVEFWIKLKDDLGITKNPVVKNKIFLGQVKEEFSTKIGSKLEISQKGYFADEIFGNSGPLPPEVGQITTYTIMWQIKNYYNDVKNVKVKAILPKGVELTGKIFPEEESSKFSFDPQSKEVVWSLEDLETGKGVLNPSPNVAFQIAFTPNSAQRGQTPEIIGEAKISGEDTWTNQILQAFSMPITTVLPDDDTITEEQGIVK